MIDMKKLSSKLLYREKISDELNEIIVSLKFFYITDDEFEVEVEFEPLGMVGEGEGWLWRSSRMSLFEVESFINEFIGMNLSELVELPDSEKYCYYEGELFDKNGMQSLLFEEKYFAGYLLLPKLPDGSIWKKKPSFVKTVSI
ncbi:hypothetical protein [Budvicia aquatica]|uniref:Uncharacterized protein n=2 Tax=Budvicia aquatica TaxID=82979 RepID=A0A2C6DTS7_9GAMM|nr:hypothetical protein [Budvicia aquatica]PHI31732.1 hypothetical protein CRN84_21570 [Budvicia aquatica]